MAAPELGFNPVENIRRTILIVDDEEVNCIILMNLLKADYETRTASNGLEALQILRTSRQHISMVLLDLMMPKMNGYEVLQAMKEDPVLSKIPVIATTSSEGDEDEIRALSLGAADFVTKPYNQQIIRYRVANTIKLVESTAIITMIERDAKTGLYTKEFFFTYCEELMAENPDIQYDIIAIDINNFKLYNDLYGRTAGDELLKKAADAIKDASHIIGGIVCRTEADHFMVFLPQRAHYNVFLPNLFRFMATKSSDRINVKFRFGIYSVTDRSIPFGSMCDRAFIASDIAKNKYNTILVRYDESMRKTMMDEQLLIGSFDEALAQKQFILYFQPKYRLADGKLIGAEALVRWSHPERGLIPPGQFIPLFEQNGQISTLDKYVWDAAAEHISSWIRQYGKSLPISVNISRVDIYEPMLPEILEHILSFHGLTSKELYLEITESAYTRDPDQLISIVNKLREKGFLIEMDDFGSGYSSLNMLSKLPIDVLKLDLKFLEGTHATVENPGILPHVMGIARYMKVNVIAEGVETLDQVALLKKIGCDFVQGYYYSKPLPPDEFVKKMLAEF